MSHNSLVTTAHINSLISFRLATTDGKSWPTFTQIVFTVPKGTEGLLVHALVNTSLQKFETALPNI